MATTSSSSPTPPLAADNQRPLLSGSDVQIMRYLAKGHSNKEIAALIGRSPYTVKDRVRHIATVLGVRTRTAIVAAAIRAGLI